jgi:hypothetical protein
MLNRFVLKSYLKSHLQCPPNETIYAIELVCTTLPFKNFAATSWRKKAASQDKVGLTEQNI